MMEKRENKRFRRNLTRGTMDESNKERSRNSFKKRDDVVGLVLVRKKKTEWS